MCAWCDSEKMRPLWCLDLTLQHTHGSRVRATTLAVLGAVLDPLMAMTVEDYLALTSRFGNLDGYVRRFYERAAFDIGWRGRELLAISLPPGSQLTFLNWLGLQPNFDIGMLVGAVLATDDGELDCAAGGPELEMLKSDTVDGVVKADDVSN
jgi:hypothetical protein